MKISTKKSTANTEDLTIEFVLKTNGFLFPETVEEVIEFEKNFGNTNVILPNSLETPDFLYTKKSNSTIIQSAQPENLAMAARNGKNTIPNDVLEIMKSDRRKSDLENKIKGK